MTTPFPDIDAKTANERCLKTLCGLRDIAVKRKARELYEDLSRAILIVEESIKKAT